MPTNTYVALRTEVLTSAAPSVTFNLSGITGYTDLVMVVSLNQATGLAQNMLMRLNGDTTSIYSDTIISGTGSVAESVRNSNQTRFQMDRYGFAPSTGFNNNIIQIMNYSNTTTFKTILNRSNNAASGTDAMVHLWRNTAAITSIEVYAGSGGTWAVGSTFTIYGIANADNFAKATGGIISEDATYWYHTFAANGTFTPKQALTCDYLVVAGGGGGANPFINSSTIGGGGGGAGGYRTTVGTSGGGGSAETPLSLTAISYAITVGGGGAGNSGVDQGGTGSNSVFSTITSNGGGGGARQSRNGGAGGSGGGASCSDTTGGARTVNQGFVGSNGQVGGAFSSGAGGGGAGAAGSVQPSTTAGGAGGVGVLSPITGTYLAGGGGGGAQTTIGAGGLGGGGNGSTSTTGNAGVANTGGGAGGIYGNATGANGGSGIVIVRYAK